MRILRKFPPLQTNTKKQGFTLLEIAVVMIISAFVVAAIWAAGSAVMRNGRVVDAVGQINQMSTSIRNIYTGRNFTGALDADVTATMITQNVVLPDIRDQAAPTTTARNPWNGTYQIFFHQPNQFYIQVNIPANFPDSRAICINMVSSITGTGTKRANGNPFPNILPVAESTQGGYPTNIYVQAGGWLDVTGDDADTISGNMGGNNCTGLSFYYAM